MDDYTFAQILRAMPDESRIAIAEHYRQELLAQIDEYIVTLEATLPESEYELYCARGTRRALLDYSQDALFYRAIRKLRREG